MRLPQTCPCGCGRLVAAIRADETLTWCGWIGITALAIAGLVFMLVAGSGCAWLDDAAVAAQPDLDARMAKAINDAVAKATAEHRVPTEADLENAAAAEVDAWKNDPARRRAYLAALARHGIQMATGDPVGGLVGLAGAALTGYLTLRATEATAKAGVRRYRRRKNQPDAARGPPA